ncbi:MAG: sulfite exporter TauE/SafE family protein [Hyphomicrobiaceae bacterium]
MITDPWFYAAAIPAILLVGMAKGGFGGPIALLGVPLISLVVSPVQAAGIMLPILCAMDVVGLLAYRGTFDRGSLAILLPAAAVGIAVGWLAAAYVTDAHVRLLVGVVAVAFTLDYWLGGARKLMPAEPNRAKGSLWGAVAGFTSFVSHAGGPPFQMYILPLRLAPRLLAGTAVIFFAVVNQLKLVPYYMLGQFTGQNLATSAVLLPLAALATAFGVYLVKRVDVAVFYRVTYMCVFVVGVKLIYDGATRLAGF